MRRWIKPLVEDRIYCAAVFRSFVLVFVASCSSNRNWQDWTQALMKDLTANIDVMLQNNGHFFFLLDILVNCSRCWRWGVISKDREELAGQQLQWIITISGTLYFLWEKDKGLGLPRRVFLVLAQLAAWSGSFMAAECICHWCGGSDWCIASRWFGEVPLRLVGLAYGPTRPFLLLDFFQTIFRALHHQTSLLLNNGWYMWIREPLFEDFLKTSSCYTIAKSTTY